MDSSCAPQKHEAGCVPGADHVGYAQSHDFTDTVQRAAYGTMLRDNSLNRVAARSTIMSFRYCWEDFTPGRVFEHGSRTLTEMDIVGFAREWDPQRYHVDPEAARQTPFGGLIASGWQSCAVAMRLMCDAYLNESSCVGSPGIDEIRFLAPVRPGDALRFRSTVLESMPSRSQPSRGTVKFRWDLVNQRGETVLSMVGLQLYLRRAPGPA